MSVFKNRPRWLGAPWPELDAEFLIEEVDSVEPDLMEKLAIASTLRIAELETQLDEAMGLMAWQGQTIAAAREFVELIAAINAKTGENVFKTTQDDDTLAAQTLNHRFVDLAALLNQSIRPVPAKLAKGTVH